MWLSFDKSQCTECGACLAICPHKPASTRILLCTHCDPKTAQCRLSCPKGAIKEESGILYVDQDVCDGCGQCTCPNGAILFQDGKALKCDLCFGNPRCVQACPENLICFERAPFLGWRISDSGTQYSVGLPQLSPEEDELVRRAVFDFREISKTRKFKNRRDAESLFRDIVLGYSKQGLIIEKDQYEYLVNACSLCATGFGVIEPLLSDDELEEIAVIGLGKPIYVYRRSEGWLRTDASFVSPDSFIDVVNKMSRPLGRRITFQTPTINAVLPDGSRLHASIPPLSDFEMTIRKFRRNPISAPELIEFRTFSSLSLSILWLAMLADMSILFCGNTASGKTSTLNAVFSFVPLDERVVIIEETPEINIPHPHLVRLVSNPELGLGIDRLVHDSLRMRPDRVIVGEVRTPAETRALFDSFVSGQARSTYATFHARSAKEAVSRIESMGIRKSDISSIDIIAVQKRISSSATKHPRELRRATEISHCSDGKFTSAFSYDRKSDSLRPSAKLSVLQDDLCERLSMSRKELQLELGKRSAFISSMASRRHSFQKTLESISCYPG